ncbi:hypothetical protein J6590_075552 [Homalodisca vitripennis]|nr:hypothetical protein J6590_016222 [Homalodisca vitripennis]KAG8335152.1 hypothetical protein J6590_075552 [Homalodisca vitripennis]
MKNDCIKQYELLQTAGVISTLPLSVTSPIKSNYPAAHRRRGAGLTPDIVAPDEIQVNKLLGTSLLGFVFITIPSIYFRVT